jgi:hypothetical protein
MAMNNNIIYILLVIEFQTNITNSIAIQDVILV